MTTKIKIINIAGISSGVYLSATPHGEVAYLQVKDYSTPDPVKTAAKVDMSAKVANNLLQKGDILFACKGGVYLAACYDEDDRPAVASTAFFVIRITQPAILPEYLCRFLNQPATKEYFRVRQQGTGVPVIRKAVIENLEVPVPELAIQQTVIRLSELSERACRLREKIAQKDKLLVNRMIMKILK